jgi:hypothetical protein
MCVLILIGDCSSTTKGISKLLGIDEFKLGFKVKDIFNQVKHLS